MTNLTTDTKPNQPEMVFYGWCFMVGFSIVVLYIYIIFIVKNTIHPFIFYCELL